MDYPNIEAMASGTISGKFTEWPRVRPEAKALLAELAALREENARLRGYMRPDQIEEAETVTKLIRERDEARAEVEKERAYADASNQDAVAAEAKLARCVEALGEIRVRSLAAKTHEVGPLEAKGRLTRILELACAALAAVKGGE